MLLINYYYYYYRLYDTLQRKIICVSAYFCISVYAMVVINVIHNFNYYLGGNEPAEIIRVDMMENEVSYSIVVVVVVIVVVIIYNCCRRWTSEMVSFVCAIILKWYVSS